jgi:hypothetical protein
MSLVVPRCYRSPTCATPRMTAVTHACRVSVHRWNAGAWANRQEADGGEGVRVLYSSTAASECSQYYSVNVIFVELWSHTCFTMAISVCWSDRCSSVSGTGTPSLTSNMSLARSTSAQPLEMRSRRQGSTYGCAARTQSRSGDTPASSSASTSAPASRRARAHRAHPPSTAMCSGVVPVRVRLFGSPPRIRTVTTVAMWRPLAARCSSVDLSSLSAVKRSALRHSIG